MSAFKKTIILNIIFLFICINISFALNDGDSLPTFSKEQICYDVPWGITEKDIWNTKTKPNNWYVEVHKQPNENNYKWKLVLVKESNTKYPLGYCVPYDCGEYDTPPSLSDINNLWAPYGGYFKKIPLIPGIDVNTPITHPNSSFYVIDLFEYVPIPKHISLIFPENQLTLNFKTFKGKINFKFSKTFNDDKRIIHFKLYDPVNLNTLDFPIVLSLTNEDDDYFKIEDNIIHFTLPINSELWNLLALYDISWKVESFNSNNQLISNSKENQISFNSNDSIIQITNNYQIYQDDTDTDIKFEWEKYPDCVEYSILMANINENIMYKFNIKYDSKFTLNTSYFPYGDWYWTIIGYDSKGNMYPENFNIYKFTFENNIIDQFKKLE